MPSPRRPGGRCIIRRLMLLVLMLALRKEGGGSDDRVDADEDADEDGGGGSGGTEEATEVPNTTVGARLWLVPDGAIGTTVTCDCAGVVGAIGTIVTAGALPPLLLLLPLLLDGTSS